jgi:23S rRNA pseudouridine1911/1915/1917 synthase
MSVKQRRNHMEKMVHTILEQQKGYRIGKVISTLDEEWSRTQVQQWIK